MLSPRAYHAFSKDASLACKTRAFCRPSVGRSAAIIVFATRLPMALYPYIELAIELGSDNLYHHQIRILATTSLERVCDSACSESKAPSCGQCLTSLRRSSSSHDEVCVPRDPQTALNLQTNVSTVFCEAERRDLTKMMHGVELANLHKPSADTLHDLSASLQTLAPVGLPLE